MQTKSFQCAGVLVHVNRLKPGSPTFFTPQTGFTLKIFLGTGSLTSHIYSIIYAIMWFDQCGAVVQHCNSALLDAIEEHPPHYFIYIYIYIHTYTVFSLGFFSAVVAGLFPMGHAPSPPKNHMHSEFNLL